MQTRQQYQFTDAKFEKDVLANDRPVLVDFWADWCGPCHALAPTIEALSEQYDGRVRVGKLNVDENPAAAEAYGIRSIPAVLLFDKGEVVERIVGVQPRGQYEAVLTAVADAGSVPS